ncbi:CWC22 [Sanghuangporus vaninii]
MSTATLPPVSDIPSGHFASKRKRSTSPSLVQDAASPPPTNRRRSVSPPGPRAKPDIPRVDDVDPVRRRERERQLALKMAEKELNGKDDEKEKDKEKAKELDAKAEFAKLLSSRSGGVYIPPARLRAMQAEAAAKDKSSAEYQRLSWDALRKSITGIVNRVNISNIKDVVPELFSENLIRGRGLFCRSIMKAQASSLPFTPVFAALVAIINTKLPQIGELLLTRLISQFRRAFKRNDKTLCISTTMFIAHLVNQAVAHEIIALQILVLLLERPTDDSIEIAVGFMREVGAYLAENSPKANASVYERFRAVLNEGSISQRVQYMIEVLMQVRKDKYKDNPIIPEGLDLVLEEEQITHQIGLDDELQVQDGLNIFKFDPKYLENEEKYKEIKAEILGEDSDEEEDSEGDSDESSKEEEVEEKEGIEDQTSTNLVNLRRTIYLTIMNALNYEEAVHKLLKVQINEGEEIELIKMVIECCSQERTYSKFYGLIGERFSKLNRVWTDALEQAFRDYYDTIHRYETNRLRNIARFFGHMVATDAISWTVFDAIRMNEDDTTSSSRIFVKILFQEVVEAMGIKTVAERFKDPEIKKFCEGMFPMDNPKNTRFSINYFTSIGLGVVTEEMREHLKNAPRLIMEQRRALMEEELSSSESDSDPTSSDSDDSDDDSESDEDEDEDESDSRSRRGSRRRRAPSSSVSRSRSPRRKRSLTPPRWERGRYDSRSRSPPRRARGRSDSRTPSPSARRPPPRGRSDSRSLSPPSTRRPPIDRERERYREPEPSGRYGRGHSPNGRYKERERSPPPPRDYSPNGRHRFHSRSPPPHMAREPPTRYDDRDRDRGYPRRGGRDDYSPPPRRRSPTPDYRGREKDRYQSGRGRTPSESPSRSPPPSKMRRPRSPSPIPDRHRERDRDYDRTAPRYRDDRETEVDRRR